MARIETAFLSAEGNTTPSVPEFAPVSLSDASSKVTEAGKAFPQGDVRAVRQGLSDEPLTAAKRLEVAAHAQALADYFEAEYRLFWALWTRDGLFDQKAAYDIAMSNYLRATQIRDSLMRGSKS